MEWSLGYNVKLGKKKKKEGPTLQYMEICSMLCGSLDGRGVWGKMDMYMYGWKKVK